MAHVQKQDQAKATHPDYILCSVVPGKGRATSFLTNKNSEMNEACGGSQLVNRKEYKQAESEKESGGEG